MRRDAAAERAFAVTMLLITMARHADDIDAARAFMLAAAIRRYAAEREARSLFFRHLRHLRHAIADMMPPLMPSFIG